MEQTSLLTEKINPESILRNIAIQRMNWLIEMSKVDSNLSSHTDRHLMLGSPVLLFFLVDQSVSLQTDRSEHSTLVQEKESFSSFHQLNFSTMISSSKKITKRFKKLCSVGCSTMTSISSKALKMNLN